VFVVCGGSLVGNSVGTYYLHPSIIGMSMKAVAYAFVQFRDASMVSPDWKHYTDGVIHKAAKDFDLGIGDFFDDWP